MVLQLLDNHFPFVVVSQLCKTIIDTIALATEYELLIPKSHNSRAVHMCTPPISADNLVS